MNDSDFYIPKPGEQVEFVDLDGHWLTGIVDGLPSEHRHLQFDYDDQPWPGPGVNVWTGPHSFRGVCVKYLRQNQCQAGQADASDPLQLFLICQACGGLGEIEVPTYPGSPTVAMRTCRTCNGERVIL